MRLLEPSKIRQTAAHSTHDIVHSNFAARARHLLLYSRSLTITLAHGQCMPLTLQASKTDPLKAAATADALSALLVLLVPPGSAPHDATPPPGDLLTEPCLAGATACCTALPYSAGLAPMPRPMPLPGRPLS